MIDVLKDWTQRLRGPSETVKAENLYLGRGFREAVSTAQALEGTHYIVSAGLGFVNTQSSIPSYSLTLSPGSPDSVAKKFEDQATADRWWTTLCKQSPFSARIDLRKFDLVLIALPREYLRAALPALAATTDTKKLRIISRGDNSHVPDELAASVINYDDRLDGVGSPVAGTMSDFASRAARHFAENVLLAHPRAPAAKHQEIVDKLLAAYPVREIPTRQKATDDEVKGLILANWHEVGGQSGKMLRHLRDNLQVACEQSRFKNLFRAVAATRAVQ